MAYDRKIILPFGKIIPYELLQELEQLINSHAKETTLHKFLEKNPEILPGIDPACVFSKKRIEFPNGRVVIPDLIVKPINKKFFDIIELKGANEEIMKGKKIYKDKPSKARNFRANVYQAMRQLQLYSDLFEDGDNRKYVKQRLNIDIYRPTLILLMGRNHSFLDELEKRDFECQYSGIELKTWDDLLSDVKQNTIQRIVIPVTIDININSHIVLRNLDQENVFKQVTTIYGNEESGIAIFSEQELLDISKNATTQKNTFLKRDDILIPKDNNKLKNYDIAETIAILRLIRGKTQSQLASEIGVGQEYISYLEKNKRSPSLDTLKKLIRPLGIDSLSKFFDIAERLPRLGSNKMVDYLKNKEDGKGILRNLLNDLEH
jgi:transcriptional regulator with XRE-family HTH domain